MTVGLVADLMEAIGRQAAADAAWDAFKAEHDIREGYCYFVDTPIYARWGRLERETYAAASAVRRATARLTEAEREEG
jgi:hypothetical protein